MSMDGKDIGELRKAYALLRESNEKLYNSMKAFQIAAEVLFFPTIPKNR